MLSNSLVVNSARKVTQKHTKTVRNTSMRTEQPAGLAPYASHPAGSRGRLIAEPDCATRSVFARDRDRIIHSNAFRRLNHKTQVFIYHEGDHFRSRLTHSLEVSQIARSLAGLLRLNADLCEAIALAHDIGHTAFGHAGERALREVFAGFGGFDHNLQTLRTLTVLEQRYAAFDGLNLSFETLEGLIKHNGPLFDEDGQLLDEGHRDRVGLLRWYDQKFGFGLHQYASAEGQVAAICDDIAYNNHDLDDGLRAGLFTIDDLRAIPFVFGLVEDLRTQYRDIDDKRLVFELNRRLITLMISDVRQETEKRLAGLSPRCSDDIRAAGAPVVAFSDEFSAHLEQLRRFLFKTVYRNEQVMAIMGDAEKIIRDLVAHYMERPENLPKQWRDRLNLANVNECAGQIRDFVAGMTDRYIIDLHGALFDATPKLR